MKSSRNTARQDTPQAVQASQSSKRSSFTATEAKNEFGRLLERAISGDAIVITRHDAPKAVLISIDEYNAMKRSSELHLDELTAEFDAMFDRMQTPKARRAME